MVSAPFVASAEKGQLSACLTYAVQFDRPVLPVSDTFWDHNLKDFRGSDSMKIQAITPAQALQLT